MRSAVVHHESVFRNRAKSFLERSGFGPVYTTASNEAALTHMFYRRLDLFLLEDCEDYTPVWREVQSPDFRGMLVAVSNTDPTRSRVLANARVAAVLPKEYYPHLLGSILLRMLDLSAARESTVTPFPPRQRPPGAPIDRIIPPTSRP